MPMRDYEELKNLKIPAEQERIMDIICDAWEECRATDCQSECKDNQVLPCERTLFACTALKYSRKIHEAGYAPAKWIDVKDRLPELEETVLVLDRRGNKMVRTLRKLSSEKEPSFRPDGLLPQKHITHWMPIPDPPEVEKQKGEWAMKMSDTIDKMLSKDPKDRMWAEYWQAKIRYRKLKAFANRIEAARLQEKPEPQHSCSYDLLRKQQSIMGEYLHVLELRLAIDGLNIDIEEAEKTEEE